MKSKLCFTKTATAIMLTLFFTFLGTIIVPLEGLAAVSTTGGFFSGFEAGQDMVWYDGTFSNAVHHSGSWSMTYTGFSKQTNITWPATSTTHINVWCYTSSCTSVIGYYDKDGHEKDFGTACNAPSWNNKSIDFNPATQTTGLISKATFNCTNGYLDDVTVNWKLPAKTEYVNTTSTEYVFQYQTSTNALAYANNAIWVSTTAAGSNFFNMLKAAIPFIIIFTIVLFFIHWLMRRFR